MLNTYTVGSETFIMKGENIIWLAGHYWNFILPSFFNWLWKVGKLDACFIKDSKFHDTLQNVQERLSLEISNARIQKVGYFLCAGMTDPTLGSCSYPWLLVLLVCGGQDCDGNQWLLMLGHLNVSLGQSLCVDKVEYSAFSAKLWQGVIHVQSRMGLLRGLIFSNKRKWIQKKRNIIRREDLCLCDWGSCHPCPNNEPTFSYSDLFFLSSWFKINIVCTTFEYMPQCMVGC